MASGLRTLQMSVPSVGYLSLTLELLNPVGPQGQPALDEHPDDAAHER